MGFFRSEENVNDLFDKLNESNIEHDESVFYNGGHPIWDKNFREGVSYMFVVDNDSSGPVYWVKDDINSWRPFSVDFFNRFFSKFDYDETDKLFESEEDDLEWARDVISNPFNGIKIGDVYYIVDTDSSDPNPDNYKPVSARYILVVTNIKEGGRIKQLGINDDIFLESKYCTPDDATYNSNDYYETSPKCWGFEEDNKAYNLTGVNWAKHLMDLKYWRKMS
jgi:hypothetical protein